MTTNERTGHLRGAVREALSLLYQSRETENEDISLEPIIVHRPDPDFVMEAAAILEDVLKETA